jgi:carboxyl-terminal processing protease
MKNHIKIVIAVIVLSISLLAFNIFKTPQNNPEKDKLLLELLQFVISNYHYEQKDINDDFSKAVYKDYISMLDSDKKFFLKSDIDEFSKYELQIDDAIKNKDLTFFDLTYNRLRKRIDESKIYYKDILAKPFEYFTEESIQMNSEKNQYATTAEELKDNWRKIIKIATLANLTEKMKAEEDKKNGVNRLRTFKHHKRR